MIIPPLFSGCIVLFWGIETDHILVAVTLAALLESSHLLKGKLHFTTDDFVRVSDLTSVFFITTIALILLNEEPNLFFRLLVIWLPIALSPLMIAQLYSSHEKIIIGTKIGGKKSSKTFRHRPMDFRTLYLSATLLAITAANTRSQFFFPAASVLICWLLFANRGKGYPTGILVSIISLIVLAGYFSYGGVEKFHHYLKKKQHSFWKGYYLNHITNPYHTSIAYGSIGRLKTSGKILVRIFPQHDKIPQYLVESSYNIFSKNQWHSHARPFTFTPFLSEHTWQLQKKIAAENEVSEITMEQNFPHEKGLLIHPQGVLLLHAPNIFELKNNRENVLKALECAPVVTSKFSFATALPSTNDKPDKYNLIIPKEEQETILRFTRAFWNGQMTKKEKLASLKKYFSKNFSYTLELQDRGSAQTVLDNFLNNTRKGHCELYATATTLALRMASIPTRYVRGFSIVEYSSLESAWIIRSRHAHAWCEAYIDNRWEIVDTTPPDWSNHDQEQAGIFEPLRDFFSFLHQKYKKFQISNDQNYRIQLSILVILLAAFLVLRIYGRMQTQKQHANIAPAKKRIFHAQPSPFLRVEQFYDKQGVTRLEGESFHSWLSRLEKTIGTDRDKLISLHNLHLRLRFDHDNFSGSDMQLFEEKTRKFLVFCENRRNPGV